MKIQPGRAEGPCAERTSPDWGCTIHTQHVELPEIRKLSVHRTVKEARSKLNGRPFLTIILIEKEYILYQKGRLFYVKAATITEN